MAEEDQNENQDSVDEQIRFSLSINLDRESFFRRACPSCGLEFKTEGNPADFAWALELQLHRVSEEEENDDPATVAEETPKETLRCPYCQHLAESSEMHTAETVSYLKRFALREFALPKLYKRLAEFSESIRRMGSRGGGLFSVSISSNYERPPLPPRPIYGPDAPDMKIVHFLCCGKKIKISEGWTDITLCTYCETPVSLV